MRRLMVRRPAEVVFLLIDHLKDQLLVRKRAEVRDEIGRLHHESHVELLAMAPFAVRTKRDHLSGRNRDHFATMSTRDVSFSLQHHDFGNPLRVKFDQAGSAGNGGAECCRIDVNRGGVWRGLDQDRASTKIHRASGAVETEDGVRAQPSDAQIAKGQFCPRIGSSADAVTWPNLITNDSGASGISANKLNVFYDPCDTRLLGVLSKGGLPPGKTNDYQCKRDRSVDKTAESKVCGILHSAEKGDCLRSLLLGQAFLTQAFPGRPDAPVATEKRTNSVSSTGSKEFAPPAAGLHRAIAGREETRRRSLRLEMDSWRDREPRPRFHRQKSQG